MILGYFIFYSPNLLNIVISDRIGFTMKKCITKLNYLVYSSATAVKYFAVVDLSLLIHGCLVNGWREISSICMRF